ncbi:MAG: hypothetical protein CL676_03610 [Bdellovibrionaceae bacterium]|nr:hypothetical protein [Pseudobdellovibrionaceae bacterium]|tara:strand:+ start:2897 stop:3706 length:810 start_codon:yes stop_codon:yes gene_type:complete
MIRIIILLNLLFPTLAQAKDVYFGNGVSNISIKWEMIDPLNPKLGLRPTYLRFPKPVYRFDNATLFSIEAAKGRNGQADFRELKIYPRRVKGSQQVEIVLQDRSIIRARFTISKDDGLALSYDFRPEKIPNLESKHDEKFISELDVMKSILLGQIPFGMKERKIGSRLNCRERGVSATILRSIEGLGYKVYQVRLANSSKNDFKLLPHRIYFLRRNLSKPELKHLESEILKSKGSTIITILGDPSSSIWRAKLCDQNSQLIALEKRKKR